METAVVKANEIISAFIRDTNDVLSKRSWYEYTTYAEVDEALRLHRMRKKFCIPTAEGAEARRERTVREFLDRNNRTVLQRSALWYRLREKQPGWEFLAQARELVHSLFREKRADTTGYFSAIEQFRIRNARLIVGPGETVQSHQGDVSLIAKLHHQKWTVTRDAEKDAKHLARNHRMMRRIVLKEGFALVRKYKVSRGDLTQAEWRNLVFELGWRRKRVIVSGSRLAVVPKNNEVDRLINVEPLLNVVLQQWVSGLLSAALKRVGLDLEKNQSLHKKLCHKLEFGTFDFSSASDSYGCGLVEYLFPQFVTVKLMKYRSKTIDTGSGIIPASVFGLMGNATTFTVLTTVVWAIASAIARPSWVYGDDLVAPASKGRALIHTFQKVGFTLNEEKSFFSGTIRESCGSFVRNGEELRSYDIRACESLADVIITANKVRRMAVWSAWKSRWFDLWASLCALVEEKYHGPFSDRDDPKEIPTWLEVPSGGTTAGRGVIAWFREHTGVDAVMVTCLAFSQAQLELGIGSMDAGLHRINSLSRPIRHRRGAGVWEDQKVVVAIDGRLVGTAKELRLQRSKFIEHRKAWLVGPRPRDLGM